MTDTLIEKAPPRNLTQTKARLQVRWQRWALVFGVFFAALIPRLLDLNVFLTADEDDQIMFAHLFLKSVLEGDVGGALVLGYPGVPTLMLGGLGVGLRYLFHYAGWLPLPWVTTDLMTTLTQVTPRFGVFDYPLDFLVWVRVPIAIVASLSIVGVYLLAKRLLDEKLALLGTLMIAFAPFILAHTRVIHVDAPLAYFMFLSFLAFVLYLHQGGWKWLLLSGLFGGLAALSKTAAALLGPILVVSGLFYALFPPVETPRSVRWKRLVIALIVWGLIAAAAFFALWPSMWTRPLFALQWIINNVRSVNSSFHPTTGRFWGGGESDQSPYYYLIAFPYHLTPLTTIGVIGGVAMIISGLIAYWRKSTSEIGRWLIRVLPLALGLLAYVIVFIAPVSLISRRGDRYILPVYFATGLLSALALWWFVAVVKKYFPTLMDRLNLTPTRVIGITVFIQIVFVLFYHPYYLAYYNPLAGGAKTAPYRLNIGWGEGLDQAARFLSDLTEDETPQVAAWYSGQFAPYYQGPTIDLSDHSSALTADYTVFYINQVQRGFPSEELLDYFQQRDPLQIVKIGGIDYVWVYDGQVISRTPPKDFAFPVEALLGGRARLIGLDLPTARMPADAYTFLPEAKKTALPYRPFEGIPITLYWETLGRMSNNHINIYIRLVDDQGNVWGQIDRMIIGGLWRPKSWYAGYFLRDEYKLRVDPATPPGTYHFEVGMYDYETGASFGVAKNIGEIVLTPPRRLPQPDELDLRTTEVMPVNESLTLVGHNFVDSHLPPGSEIVGKIFWQATNTIGQDYRIEFSLLGSDQREYVISDMPLSESYPSSQWRRSEVVGAAYRFRIPAVAPPGKYPLSVNVIESQTGERIGPATILGQISIETQNRNFELPNGITPISAVINEEVELVGYKLVDTTVAPRESFGLTLYWHNLGFASENYTVFVHAVGPDQIIRGQWDSMPVQGKHPTSGWIPGEIIEDHYEIPMDKNAPPWKYDIFVGMYDSHSGERLYLRSQNAPTSDNRVWLTRVQVIE